MMRTTWIPTHLPSLLVLSHPEPFETILQCVIDLLKSELLVRASVDRQLDKDRIGLVRFLSLRRIWECPEIDVLIRRNS